MSQPEHLEELEVSSQELAGITQFLGDERLLDKDQASKFLCVSPRTIESWVFNMVNKRKAGRSRERIPFVKLGGRVLFLVGDLRRFRDERRKAA